MNLNAIKATTNIVVYSSVNYVVQNAVSNVTSPPQTRVQAVKLAIGGLAIGGLVAEHASTRVEKKIDKVAAFWEKWKEAAAEEETSPEEKTEEEPATQA